MKKLLIVKNVVEWSLLLLIAVQFALAYYYGWELQPMTKGNRLYLYALETICIYDVFKSLFKRLSQAKSPQQPIVCGDVVILKSGGPKMVASVYDDHSGWLCRWFDEGKAESMWFKSDIINRA